MLLQVKYPLLRNESEFLVAADATFVWSANDWACTNKADATHISSLNVWFADLPTEDCPDGSLIEFTFFWNEGQRWEGKNYSVAVGGPK